MPVPMLVFHFGEAGLVTVAEAAERLGGGKRQAYKHLAYLRAKGWAFPVHRGLYQLAVRPGHPPPPPDPLLVASKLVEPYAVSHHAALEAHGVAQSATSRLVTVATPRKFTPFGHVGVAYRPVQTPLRLLEGATVTKKRRGLPVVVTDPEMTLTMCLDRLDLSGGLEEVLKSVRGFPYLDADRLLRHLGRLRRNAAYQRVGWVLELYADHWGLPEETLRRVERFVRPRAAYLGVRPRQGGRLVRRWNLVVPPNVEAVLRAA